MRLAGERSFYCQYLSTSVKSLCSWLKSYSQEGRGRWPEGGFCHLFDDQILSSHGVEGGGCHGGKSRVLALGAGLFLTVLSWTIPPLYCRTAAWDAISVSLNVLTDHPPMSAMSALKRSLLLLDHSILLPWGHRTLEPFPITDSLLQAIDCDLSHISVYPIYSLDSHMVSPLVALSVLIHRNPSKSLNLQKK